MKKLALMLMALSVFFMAGISFGQNGGEIEWLSQLDKQPAVSYGDAVNLFMYQLGKTPSAFEQDSVILRSAGVALDGYNKDSILTKGMLSKMTARYLDLSGSLMYSITGFERYAFKACIADGIFSGDGSENDSVSGTAMIEVFSKISELKEGQK